MSGGHIPRKELPDRVVRRPSVSVRNMNPSLPGDSREQKISLGSMERNKVNMDDESLVDEDWDNALSDSDGIGGGAVDIIIEVAAGDTVNGCGPPPFTTDGIAPVVDTPFTSIRSARSSRKDSSFRCFSSWINNYNQYRL